MFIPDGMQRSIPIDRAHSVQRHGPRVAAIDAISPISSTVRTRSVQAAHDGIICDVVLTSCCSSF
jgi:hypothetical protein